MLDISTEEMRYWWRWLIGVVAAVLVALVIVNATIREQAFDGCVRAGEQRITSAQKNARDANKEFYLASITHGEEAKQHTNAAGGASQAAVADSKAAGVPYAGLDVASETNYGLPYVRDAIDDACNERYPYTFPYNLLQKVGL